MAQAIGIGMLLRRFRTAVGLSQEALAERAGLSVRGISDIERGLKGRPYVDTLQRLADALELSASDREAFLAARAVSTIDQKSPTHLPEFGEGGRSSSQRPTATITERHAIIGGPRIQRYGGGLRTNLGDEPTRFIGRDREIVAVSVLLTRPGVRLVTLTGVGGIGKTRLAMTVAARLFDQFSDGVFFVPLASVADPDMVASTIASVLSMDRTEEILSSHALEEYLKSRHLLLVLDNLEHLLDASTLMARLLDTCPHLHILVTSRAVLHLVREHVFDVPPLELPDAGQQVTIDILAQFDAVALFVERACAALHGFTLTKDNAPHVAAICQRLDALPLAIELAAARVRVLPLEALLRRLEYKLELLTGGAQDLPARHQTLRASLDWSYDLLGPAEQDLFRRLAFFVGGWTLDAADAVLQGDSDVLERTFALTENSLVQRQEGVAGEPRFLMLETIREYGLEKLEEHGEMDVIGGLHAAHYVAFAEQAQEQLGGRQASTWMERLEQDIGNIRASLAWMRDHGEINSMLRLASSLFLFWERHNHEREGIQWLEDALARAEDAPPLLRAAGLKVQAFLMSGIRFDRPGARARAEASVVLYRAAEIDRAGLAQSLQCFGLLSWSNRVEAKPAFEESLAIWRGLNAPGSVAMLLTNLGSMMLEEGNAERGRVLFEEALELTRIAGDTWGTGCGLASLGFVAFSQGDYARALDLCRQALTAFQEIGDRKTIAQTLEHLASIALEQGEPKRAVRLLAASKSVWSQIGLPPRTSLHSGEDFFQEYLERARAELSESEWTETWNEAIAMATEKGPDFALSPEIAL